MTNKLHFSAVVARTLSPDPVVINKLEFIGFMRGRYFIFVIGKQGDLGQVQYK